MGNEQQKEQSMKLTPGLMELIYSIRDRASQRGNIGMVEMANELLGEYIPKAVQELPEADVIPFLRRQMD
jgi:hypothetical protein